MDGDCAANLLERDEDAMLAAWHAGADWSVLMRVFDRSERAVRRALGRADMRDAERRCRRAAGLQP
ncbi:MAG: hypothetical protein JSR26_04045 [Proteobacteria bacterium]|nr:hypothetical protein [Pseudomonadota bacterium]